MQHDLDIYILALCPLVVVEECVPWLKLTSCQR